MSRNSAAFEAWVDRGLDDDRDYDEIALIVEMRMMDRADQERKGDWE